VSFVSAREQTLILDLLLGRISEHAFYAAYPIAGTVARDVGVTMLRRALAEHDGVAVEFGLYLGHRFGITDDYSDVLNELADAPWHKRHEDVIMGLAKLRSASSVDALFRAGLAKHDYLSFDERFALARKAVHALSAIQTREAIDRLGAILLQGNDVVKSYAQKELARVANAGTSEAVRAEAKRLLNT